MAKQCVEDASVEDARVKNEKCDKIKTKLGIYLEKLLFHHYQLTNYYFLLLLEN